MPEITSQDGTTIAYETVGAGRPVILVDGALCFRDSGPMRPIADALAAHGTVFLYDRRGRGASGDTLPFSLTREIEDIDALVAEAGGSAAAFGMSSGGGLLLNAAAQLGPERLSRIAVYEPPYLPEPAIPAAADYTTALTAALREGRREDAITLFLRRVGVPDEGVAGMRLSPGWPAMLALAPTLAYDDAAMGDSRVPTQLAQSARMPVLALAGEATPDFLRFGAEGVAAAVPDGRFELLPGQTHDVSAAALVSPLTSFLTS